MICKIHNKNTVCSLCGCAKHHSHSFKQPFGKHEFRNECCFNEVRKELKEVLK